MHLEPGHTCRDLADFQAVLLRWLGGLTEPTLSGGSGYRKGFLRVPIGGVWCELSGDSTRKGIADYLVACELGSGVHAVVANQKGTINRVVVAGAPTTGFYLYSVEPLAEPTVLDEDLLAGSTERPRELAESAEATPERRLGLTGLSGAELFELYAAVLAELKSRMIVRTNNAPAGDYAEWLVSKHLGVPLPVSSTKSYDLISPQHGRIQVKARVVSTPGKAGQLQAGGFSSRDFEHAAFVLLRQADYRVERAALVPRAVLEQAWTYVAHTNTWRVHMTPALMGHADAVDLTEALRLAATRLD